MLILLILASACVTIDHVYRPRPLIISNLNSYFVVLPDGSLWSWGGFSNVYGYFYEPVKIAFLSSDTEPILESL